MASLTDIEKILIDHFGEDRVDISNDYIMIYYPKVTVTNENDRSIDITKLYIKIPISPDGTMAGIFRLNRSEYTQLQFESDYMHSHVCGIPSRLEDFQEPCLGRGPIRDTISSLTERVDLDLWRLFCIELDMYVRTESLSGIPYRRLESIGATSGMYKYYLPVNSNIISICSNTGLSETKAVDILRSFIKYLISKDINFTYNSGIVNFGYSDKELSLIISNYFIEFFNSQRPGYRKVNIRDFVSFLCKCISKNGYFYKLSSTRDSMTYENIPLWTFKGEQVYSNIIRTPTPEENFILLLQPTVIKYIKNIILKTLNAYYGKIRTDKATYIL